MTQKPKKGKVISRRGIFPLLGSSLLLPFLGYNQENKPEKTTEEEEYETLLKPDGTIVKVKASTLKNSKVIKKNIPNSTFLQWLGKKF
ncbi:hypothetical protein [uncultured Muriicola sp.]|uniref:hypothetical protein n=1 Tax=uncultured Muriicola sp. TaxID=1583102 RepID=UPI0026256829|nr:hypothetical protein [uncultured Muriicola sp.]